MSSIDTALDQLVKGEVEEGFITCNDKKHQESVRVMAFNRKNKLPKVTADTISITKVVEDGNFLVKIYFKPKTDFLVRDPETGKLVPFKPSFDPASNPALQRQIELMRKDGVGEEEIEKVVANAKKEWEEANN